jgi:hypothetical protein
MRNCTINTDAQIYYIRTDCRLKERKTKQDRQCTYNITLRRVRATIVAVEER